MTDSVVNETAISLEGVGKSFVKYDDQPMLVHALRFRQRTRRSMLQAVHDLDLDIPRGQSMGVMGRNGAGKSTLLQMLCGVTAPTTGVVRVQGRVAPLISVGVGFHPELTGRENVYVNGTILGMSRSDIERRFDEIVEFSELQAFIDTPVKFYSSGMFVRLGFSVAVAADPDVLLVDEVLAVGDFLFQMKCFERMNEIRAKGTTIVVVSHNIAAIRGFCDRGIVLDAGRKVFDGEVHDAVSAYYEVMGRPPADEAAAAGATGTGVTVEQLTMLGPDGAPSLNLPSGASATLRVRVRADCDVEEPVLGLLVQSETGVVVYSDTNLVAPYPALRAGDTATYDVRLMLPLAGGTFRASVAVHRTDPLHGSVAIGQSAPLAFYVSGRGLVNGVADLGAAFTVADDEVSSAR